MTVTADTTPAELAEALTNLARTAHRLPAHWVEKRAAIHAQINDLLDAYEAAL